VSASINFTILKGKKKRGGDRGHERKPAPSQEGGKKQSGGGPSKEQGGSNREGGSASLKESKSCSPVPPEGRDPSLRKGDPSTTGDLAIKKHLMGKRGEGAGQET